MPSFDSEGEDVFFDTCDYVRTLVDSESYGRSVDDTQELVFEKFEKEFCTEELTSVRERRDRFLRGMGLDEFLSSQMDCAQDSEGYASDMAAEIILSERMTESSGAVLDSFSSQGNGGCSDSDCCIRDLDSGKRFIVEDLVQDGIFNMLREVGSDRLITLQEFEALFGLSRSVQRLMRRVVAPGEELREGLNVKQKKSRRSWWRNFMQKKPGVGICKTGVSDKDLKLPLTAGTRVKPHCKNCMEFSALYMGQEIQAHKGLIRVMRFSPSGWYLASGGEDCVVCIWQVGEVEASCLCFTTDESFKFTDEMKDMKFKIGGKGRNPATSAVPGKVFKIREAALQEFRGHTSDVLDLSWSSADCLLSSSKDKTVRMWKVGCDGCLKVFQHRDYVTCIQFNPVDDRHFISGSIDGKVRIWCVSENRVIDWADIRDIVTAVCYRLDGKGFLVGSITGNCRFYDFSDNIMQLKTQFCVQGKKKSAGKRITGLQFSPEEYEMVMITSADSKIRIFDGAEIIHKFRGRQKAKSHLSASFSSDGRYIVSVGEDSHVYIWNYDTSVSLSSKGVKSMRPCNLFFSEGVSVAVPWPAIDDIGAGLSGRNLNSYPVEVLDPSNWLKDSEHSYLGTLFFIDTLSRVAVTWPEEKLPQPLQALLQVDNYQPGYHQDHCPRFRQSPPATSSLVIVTASSDGIIRSFHNYELPVRFKR